MTVLRRLARAVAEFILGDDWRLALGVAIALGVTALVADAGLSAWWVMPVAVLALLARSVRNAGRERLDA
jgi:hypothetical protein